MIPTFSKIELYVMLQTIETRVIIGLSDPFKDFNEQEIELEWKKTYQELQRRGLLTIIDGEIKLEENFADALWIMSRTNVTVEILSDNKKKSLFYFGEENVVECSRVNHDTYTLYMHGPPDVTWNGVIYPRMLAGVEKRGKKMKDKMFIPPAMYNYYLNEGTLANSEKLEKYNGDCDVSGTVKQLTHSINRKIHNNRLMMFYKKEETWEIEGLHVLTSPTHNWTLKMVNKNDVELLEVKQSSNVEIVVEILNVLRRIGDFHL